MERNSPPENTPPTGKSPSGQFLRKLADSQLLSAEKMKAVREQLAAMQQNNSPRSLAEELVRRGVLTPYQAKLLLRGKGALTVGNYEILDRLGAGGMGVVFKARHRRMQRIVALKVLPPSAARRSPIAQRRFQQEVQAAARLHHPNIVTAFDADDIRGVSFLVMEYVEGVDLGRLVETRGALPVAAAVECMIQGCRGLEHAHAAGVIHRDVKPSNFLLDVTGVVKVLDLGLSRLENVEDAAGQRKPGTYIIGSCDYMAPEQAADPAAAGPQADVYALGATMFFLLTRQAMYTNGSAFDRVMAHRTAPAPSLREPRPEVPPALEAVYRRMVAKNLGDRYASMAAVRAALEAVAAADPATAAVRSVGLAALASGGASTGADAAPSAVPASTTGDPVSRRPSIQAWILAFVVLVVLGLLVWAVVGGVRWITG